MHTVFDPLRLSSISMDVMAVNRGTPQGIVQRQQARLAQLLEATLRGSRLYRSLWPAGTTANTPLEQLPMVTRGQLMANFDHWVTDPQINLEALRQFTADPTRIAQPWLGRYMVWESSGTSGEPGIFVQDVATMAVYDALEALRRCATRPLARWLDPLGLTERIAFVGATGGHFASYASVQRLRAINPVLSSTMRSFSIQVPTHMLVAQLNAFSPSVVVTYPTVAALLADEARSGALRARPREIWTGGESLSPAVRTHVQQTLGSLVRNSYGSSEFLAIGWECAHGHMHANTDWVILEPVDEHFRPVPPGHPSCSVLLTNLANHVQPLVRYNLSDHLTLHPERCACGSPLPVITVQGRRDEPLIMAGANGQPVTLLPLALSTVLEDEAGVFDFYLHQLDDTTLVLHIPLEGEAGRAAMVRGCAALTAFAIAQGVTAIEVRAELGQAVPRGRSGKACRITACIAD
ncbi:phenylacetate--CoA ligase family protein [Giesbergeria anulus]|uniref:Phenylacetate-coenzyme A ligase PaaK, adenylate-forming domain family n=1 Tax=Giesbergeria anulus TaxID=180197 RepID=A0A1H9IXD4_9BURK|nr:phenylacetate--CoA ligase family protein [Giesbergeria anulus]SEQ79189.1 Phenylacetate-coenzyme A ligase PaaK, adenylate-forming domain family [Giesbergeria anulus]